MSLDAELLAAHAAGDAKALIALYTRASQETDNEVAQGFYLTHAYVFALEINSPAAAGLRGHLVSLGREAP